MTLENIRRKTRELNAKTRWDLIKSIAAPLTVAAIGGFGVRFADPVLRVVFAFALVWSLAGQYFLNRGMWPAMRPEDAARVSGLDSYRREVERRRSLFSRYMLWSFGPTLFAIAALVVLLVSLGAVRGAIYKMSPFLTLMAVWLAGFFVVRMRAQRELRREIDELKSLESGG